MGLPSLNRPRKIQMDLTVIETKLFFCFVRIIYDILRYTVPKTWHVPLNIWFDLMPLVTSYLVQGFRDGRSLSPPKYLKGFLKRKFSTTSVGGWKAKLSLVLWVDLNNSSCHHWKTVDRKADGHFEWKPFVSLNLRRFIKWRSSTMVNTWESEKKKVNCQNEKHSLK